MMTHKTTAIRRHDQRRFFRVPYAGVVRYWYAPDEDGTAKCCDVGQGGVCLSLGRYLRPGRRVMLSVSGPEASTTGAEFKGEVVWCRPAATPCIFLAGVRVWHDDPETPDTLASMVHQGLAQPDVSGTVWPPKAESLEPGSGAYGVLTSPHFAHTGILSKEPAHRTPATIAESAIATA